MTESRLDDAVGAADALAVVSFPGSHYLLYLSNVSSKKCSLSSAVAVVLR
jgi:hypothetical protein